MGLVNTGTSRMSRFSNFLFFLLPSLPQPLQGQQRRLLLFAPFEVCFPLALSPSCS